MDISLLNVFLPSGTLVGEAVDHSILVQDCSISSALALEILQSRTKPLIFTLIIQFGIPCKFPATYNPSNH